MNRPRWGRATPKYFEKLQNGCTVQNRYGSFPRAGVHDRTGCTDRTKATAPRRARDGGVPKDSLCEPARRGQLNLQMHATVPVVVRGFAPTRRIEYAPLVTQTCINGVARRDHFEVDVRTRGGACCERQPRRAMPQAESRIGMGESDTVRRRFLLRILRAG